MGHPKHKKIFSWSLHCSVLILRLHVNFPPARNSSASCAPWWSPAARCSSTCCSAVGSWSSPTCCSAAAATTSRRTRWPRSCIWRNILWRAALLIPICCWNRYFWNLKDALTSFYFVRDVIHVYWQNFFVHKKDLHILWNNISSVKIKLLS